MLRKTGELKSIAFALVAMWIVNLPLSVTAWGQHQPLMIELGPEKIVFDWTTDRCSGNDIPRPEPEAAPDIPDAAARAFRDEGGNIHLIATHWTNRQEVGPDFDSLVHECDVIMESARDADFTRFADKEWIHSLYTEDGNIIHALFHNEHQGENHEGQCLSKDRNNCIYITTTYGISIDGGETFTHAEPPNHLVVALPYPYVDDGGSILISGGTNLIKKDDYYYYFFSPHGHEAQQRSVVLMRTDTLEDPKSWRCWDGDSTDDTFDGFTVELINPYFPDTDGVPPPGFDPADHVCEPVASPSENLSVSITYNSYLQKYMLVDHNGITLDKNGEPVYGFYYSLSDDLINWSPKQLLWETNAWNAPHQTPPIDRYGYPTLIDPDDTSFSFETTDNNFYLYYTIQHHGFDRDLVRREVTISDNFPPSIAISPPSESFANNEDIVSYTVSYSDSAAMNVSLDEEDILLNAEPGVDVVGVDRSVTDNGDDTWTVTLSNLNGDGALGISIDEGTAIDVLNNEAGEVGPSETFVLDNTPPSVSISSPSQSLTNFDPVQYTLMFTDENSIELKKIPDIEELITLQGEAIGTVQVNGGGNGGTMEERLVTVHGISGDGSLGFVMASGSATDGAGNEVGEAVSATFEVDNTPPSVNIGSPSVSDTKTGPVFYDLTYEGTESDLISLGPEHIEVIPPPPDGFPEPSKTVTTTGAFTRRVRIDGLSGDWTFKTRILIGTATDPAGNLALGTSLEDTELVTVDNTRPTVSIGLPTTTVTNNGPISYTVTYADADAIDLNASGVELNTHGDATGDISVTGTGPVLRTITLSNVRGNGPLWVRVRDGTASDDANNVALGTTWSAEVTVDNTPPSVSIGAPSVSETATGPVEYTVSYEGADEVNLGEDLASKFIPDSPGDTVAWAGLSAVDNGDNSWTVKLEGLSGNGVLSVRLVSGTAFDAAGNPAPHVPFTSAVVVDDTDTDGDGEPDLNDEDDDNDGMDDGYEGHPDHDCLNPLVDDADGHGDGDGLTNLEEYTISDQMNPCDPDTDGDKIDDLLDGNPLIGDNVCSGFDEAVFADAVDVGEELQCGAWEGITVDGSVRVEGMLRLISPRVIVEPGFSVGGELSIKSIHPCASCSP